MDRDQARCVLEDMPVSVFKIGLLGSVEIIAVIADRQLSGSTLVLDPILTSGRGDDPASDDIISAMRERSSHRRPCSLPTAWKRGLALKTVTKTSTRPDECARRSPALGCEYILITGTHENTPA
jgi:hydroxymethylpyrimidine/phosphomethylpyrimidine kinase